MKRESCGLIGIYNHKEAARLAYFGLYACSTGDRKVLESSPGMEKKLREERGMGLVAEVFNEKHLSHELKGNIAIGHVRYSTTGASLLRNVQPFITYFKGIHMAIGHNGNLVNTVELRRELENKGALFQTTMDSEIFVHLIAHETCSKEIEEAIISACDKVKGAYSLVMLVNNKLIGLRDPHGFRPLVLGRMGTSYVISSETCALDLMEAEYLREIEPGEMVVIDNGTLKSFFPKKRSP